MIVARQAVKPIGHVIQWWIGLTLAYVVLIFVLPANQQTMSDYRLSALEYHSLLFAISLPSILAWLAAFWGYARLRRYASALEGVSEGRRYDRLASGTGWLAWSLPLPAFVSLVFNAIADNHPGWQSAAIIIVDYLSVLLPLIAFALIANATQRLTRGARLRPSRAASRLIMALFGAAGILYCFLSLRRLDLTSLGSSNNDYALPVWLVVLTITLPYLYAWFIGLLSAYHIVLFSRQSQGLLYRQALAYVAGGLVVIIGASIALQFVNGVVPPAGHLVLNAKLVLNILFRLLIAGGFVSLAVGARRLQRMEEV